MPKRCALGCSYNNSYHRFPHPERNPEGFKAWVHIVGGKLECPADYELYRKKIICDIHFTDKDRNRNNRLNFLAVPSLHLPRKSDEKGTSEKVLEEPVKEETTLAPLKPPQTDYSASIISEHSYCQLRNTALINEKQRNPAEVETTLQQPDGNVQALAKRVLNEILSPRSERKRLRLDQSHRVTNRSCAKSVSASLNVAITCDRSGVISKVVSDQVVAAIQKSIISEACSPTRDTPGPTFNAKPLYADGVLKLWCGNDHTLAWLKKTVSSLALPASTSLVVKSQSEVQKRVRCGIAVPDDQGVYEGSTFIGRALCYQNPWIDVKRWEVVHAEKKRACWFVVLGIPEDQIPTLMNSERRLSLGLGSVYVKFQGRNGRFFDVPRGWDPATKQLLERGKTIPPPNNPEATMADPVVAGELAAPAAEAGGCVDDFDEGDLFAGLQLEGDEEGLDCDGVHFVGM